MSEVKYKTVSANSRTVIKNWILIDANGISLGRLSSVISNLIRGKHKCNYTPHVNCGDNVIVINIDKVNLTGNKWLNKKYISYSGYPGGQKIINAIDLFKKDPRRLIFKSVKGMMPKNKLSNLIISNLNLFVGEKHTYESHKPFKININDYI